MFIVHMGNKHLLSNIEVALFNKSDFIRHYIPNKNLFPNLTIKKLKILELERYQKKMSTLN